MALLPAQLQLLNLAVLVVLGLQLQPRLILALMVLGRLRVRLLLMMLVILPLTLLPLLAIAPYLIINMMVSVIPINRKNLILKQLYSLLLILHLLSSCGSSVSGSIT